MFIKLSSEEPDKLACASLSDRPFNERCPVFTVEFLQAAVVSVELLVAGWVLDRLAPTVRFTQQGLDGIGSCRPGSHHHQRRQ